VLTLNNETAEIMIATQEAIGTVQQQSSGGSLTTSTTSAERTETGVRLRVTPQINTESSEITMFIYPRVRDATTSTFTSGTSNFKDPEERSTKTSVRVQDGDTVIIGGLIRRDRSETITRVPFFSKIPILGKVLFEYRNKDRDRDRELLVFITPHIIKEPSIKLAQKRKVVLPQREQDDSKSVNRESLVSSAIKKYEK
jgi:type II secretory pathway component GspD/PulD (secretin)